MEVVGQVIMEVEANKLEEMADKITNMAYSWYPLKVYP